MTIDLSYEPGALSYDDTWDAPWFLGGAETGGTIRPFHVAINGMKFVVDLENYRRTTMQVRRLATDDSVEPGEQSLNAAGEWPRAQDNFFLGSGQEFLDNRFAFQNVYVQSGEFPSVRTRFWRSKGCDCWTENLLGMLPEQGLKRSSSNSNVMIVATMDALYASDGTELYWSTNPSASSPTWNTAGVNAASSGATISYLCTDGYRVWAACGAAGVFVTNDQSSSAAQAATNGDVTYDCTFVSYANGWLIGSGGRDLVSINSDGTTTAIWTNPSPNFKWTCAISTPSAIIVAGYAGSLSFVGAVMPDSVDEGATLSPPTVATTIPYGEQVYAIGYSAGAMLMGTSQGIRAGTRPDDTGVFDVNPVVTDPGAVLCLAPWLRFIYFGWTDYSTADAVTSPGVTSTGLGRADLSQFTQAQVPAYASDIMATDGVTGAVSSVAILNGTAYFVVDGSGVWGPTGNVVETASFETGWIRYGTTERKIFAQADLHHNPLLEGQVVSMLLADEYGNNYEVGYSEVEGSTNPPSKFGGNLVVGERFMIMLQLSRGTDETQGPEVRFWQADTMVAPQRQDEIICPIILTEEVTGTQVDGRKYRQNPLELFLAIKSLEEQGQPVPFQEGDALATQAYIDQVQFAPSGMMDDRSWFEGTCTVKLITLVSLTEEG